MYRPRVLAEVGLAAVVCSCLWLASCLPPDGGGGGGGGGGVFNLAPTVVITSDVDRGVAPLTVRFSSAGSTDDGVIVERRWDFGDGGTDVAIAPVHTYLGTGTYTVRLTLRDDDGAEAFRELVITVTEAPVAVLGVDRTAADTAPATFRFDASASFDPDAKPGDVLTYRWDFGDGARETLARVSHTYSRPGTYRVVLTVTDAAGVTGSATQLIDVGIPAPAIQFLSPSARLANIICAHASPLWVHARYQVEPAVPFRLRAGLDGDRDPCDAVTVLFDAAAGDVIHRLTGHTEPVRGAAFSPDGVLVISASEDGSVRLFHSVTGLSVRHVVPGYGALRAVAFTPGGGGFVVGAEDGTVALFETATGALVREYAGHAAGVNAVAVSPAGDRILSGDDDGVAILWRLADGSEIARFLHTLGGAPQPVYAVSFWPARKEAILTGAADQTARLWSTDDGNVIQQFAPAFSGATQVAGHSDSITGLATSSDGLELATVSLDGTARLWNIFTGAELRTFSGHEGGVRSVAFTPDDAYIVTGGDDGTARLWNLASGSLVQIYEECASPVTAVQYAPDGQTLLAAVGAFTSIQLDTNPPQGNDMNLTLPTALDLSGVPAADEGTHYFLWAEIDTDRTDPSRSYAAARVTIIPNYGADAAEAPLVPLGQAEDTAIVLPPIARTSPVPHRRVFDIGPVTAGDRIRLTLLALPGFAERFTWPGYSVQIVDSQSSLFAWFQDEFTVLDRETKLVIGHNSDRCLIALDNNGSGIVPSLRVQVERGFAPDSQPRPQAVHLHFAAAGDFTIGGSVPVSLPAFQVGTSTTAVKTAIVDRLEDLLADYNFTVTTSDGAAPTGSFTTIYFDTADPSVLLTSGGLQQSRLLQYGAPNFHDPRNQTTGGYAVIITSVLLDATPAATTDAIRGRTIANAVAHQVGLLVGLRQTTGGTNDIMASSGDLSSVALTFAPPPLGSVAPYGGVTPIGIQNGHEMLLEIVGPP